MKKILTLFLALTAIAGASAQKNFDKGNWFLGAETASLGVNVLTLDGESMTLVNFSATGGYFVSNRFAVDAMAGVLSYDGVTLFGFGAGVRYYPVGNLFARLGYTGYGMNGAEFMSNVGLRVGYDVFLSEKVFFEPAAYFDKNLGSGVNRGPNIFGLSLGFGVRF